MWARQSHLLHPLTVPMLNKVKFKWKDVEQKDFDDVKHAAAHATLLAYPYFNKCFSIHMDASDYQLVAVIIQDGKRIYLYIRKLTGPQMQYTVTE